MHWLAHGTNHKPNIGIFQPAPGAKSKISYGSMGRAPKIDDDKAVLRKILAVNLRALMKLRYANHDRETNQIKALAKDAKIGHGSVQRALAADTGVSIDLVEKLCLALDVSGYQMLLPNLNTENPQVVSGATRREQALYANMKRAAVGLPTQKAMPQATNPVSKPTAARGKDEKPARLQSEHNHDGE